MGDQKYPEEVLCYVNSVYNYNSDAGTVVASAEFEVRVILLTWVPKFSIFYLIQGIKWNTLLLLKKKLLLKIIWSCVLIHWVNLCAAICA